MKFVVTGGAGFIGYHLVKGVLGLGHEVVVLDNLCSGRNYLAEIEHQVAYHCVDIRTHSDVLAVIAEDVDWVIHCAALMPVQTNPEPTALWDVNVNGTWNVLQAAAYRGAGVLFVSSAAVYGATPGRVGESCALRGKSIYAASKIAGEALTRAMIPSDRYYILRLFNVYGPGGHGVVNQFVASALEGHPLVIHGSGNQRRDFIHVNSVVWGALRTLDPSNLFDARALNVCTGQLTSIRDLAHMVAMRRPGACIQHSNMSPGVNCSGGDPVQLFGRHLRRCCGTLESHIDKMLEGVE